MTDFLALSELESDDEELIPEILPVDARLAFTGNAKTLATLLQSAVDIAPTKEVIAYTSYVEIEGQDKTEKHSSYLKVSATDGERSISVISTEFSIRMAGSVLVPGKRLLDILKMVEEDQIRLDVLGQSATLRSGRAVWTVSTPPTNANLPDFASPAIELHPVAAKAFLKALELVYPAMSKSTSRQALMQVEVSKGYLTACDGVRAHKVLVDGLDKGIKTTMPLKFVESAIRELRAQGNDTVEFGSDHSTVIFHFGSNILMGQRLNFQYPAVDHLVLGPALTNDESLDVNVGDLMASIRRVRINADPEYSTLHLAVRQVKGEWTLTVRAKDKDGNSSQETIPCGYKGPSSMKDVTVNHRYMLEFLSCLKSGETTLKLGESTKLKQAPIYVADDGFSGSLAAVAPSFVK